MSTDTRTDEQKVAETAAAWFQTRERENGDKFDALRDGAPEWIKDAIYSAHGSGDLLPDDYVYGYAREAFDFIAENGASDDGAHEFADSVDVYTSELIAWMSSNLRRVTYCDEAADELGEVDADMNRRMMLGQYEERRAVFAAISDAVVEAAQA